MCVVCVRVCLCACVSVCIVVFRAALYQELRQLDPSYLILLAASTLAKMSGAQLSLCVRHVHACGQCVQMRKAIAILRSVRSQFNACERSTRSVVHCVCVRVSFLFI